MTGPTSLTRLSESSCAGALVLATGPAAVLTAAPPLPFPVRASAVEDGALAPSAPAPLTLVPASLVPVDALVPASPLPASPAEPAEPVSPAISLARFAANCSTSLPPTSTMTPRPNWAGGRSRSSWCAW